MDGERSTQPDDQRDDGIAGRRHTLRDPNRLHVTLENLIDLAELDTVGWSSAPPDQEGGPESPSDQPADEQLLPPAQQPPAAFTFPAPPSPPPAPPSPAQQPAQSTPVEPSPPAPPSPAAPLAQTTLTEPSSSGAAADQLAHDDELGLRARWARPAQRWLPEALALALASGAFVMPSVWLVGTALVCALGGSVAFVATGHPLRTLPWRAIRRGIRLLHPRSSSWMPVLVARVVLVSVLVPGAIAAALWLADEGRIGVFAAARSGAWTHGFRVAAALVCVMLLTSVGDGRLQRAAQLRRLARPLSDGALVVLVLGSCLLATLAIVALPRPEDRIASAADGLGWLPPPARAPADRVRDDIVTAELDALASCLSERGSTRWRKSYTSDNRAAEPDVASLVVVGSDEATPPKDLVTALMAAHNQLAPWVETIEVRLPAGGDPVRVDRTGLARHRPLTDEAELTAATTGLPALAVAPADVTLALRCSAGPVL